MPYEVPYILLQIQIQTACVNTVSEVWHKTSPFPLHYITVEEETGKENAITQQNMKNRPAHASDSRRRAASKRFLPRENNYKTCKYYNKTRGKSQEIKPPFRRRAGL
ncbi:hypothetical protein D3Z52_07065 [Clostridiaceae bacterium]|jgi:hypothetical protein|nr:hypothetical protein [Clostridiaceae bacterium]